MAYFVARACTVCPLLLSGVAAAQTGFHILAPDPGVESSGAWDITPDGRWVVGWTYLTSGPKVAALWDSALARHDLVATPMPQYSGYLAISDDASVVVVQHDRLFSAGLKEGPFTASQWPQSPGSEYSFFSLSGDGAVITGWRSPKLGPVPPEPTGPYAWNRLTGELTMLPLEMEVFGIASEDGYPSGSLHNINSTGSLIVGKVGSWLYDVAAKWTNFQVSTFAVDGPNPADATFASAISSNGRFVAGNWWNWGVIWEDGELIELVDPAPYSSIYFNLVADHGLIASSGGLVWTKDYGVQSAIDFLADHGAPVPAGWQFYGINAMSADGSTFVGKLRLENSNIWRGFVAYTNYKPCYADFNRDGGVDGSDIESFFRRWEVGDADVNLDGGVDGSDIESFFIQWAAGGCES